MAERLWKRLAALGIAFTGLLALGVAATAATSPRDAAREVDRLLAEELSTGGYTPAGSVDDATFLRRIFLDIIGEPPTPDDVLAFLWDTDGAKREKVVRLLLQDEAFGRNWSAYWRDVILYRRSEERALIAASAVQEYLTSAFNDNTSWDKIASSFITAEGDVTEVGATALIMAQNGQPEDTVAEISRIFLGIQIQCAQCHDHPTDSWKREQFHELVAFFPRVAVRQTRDGERRSFLVDANDSPAFRNPNANNRFRGTPEHYMPDLLDPQARGTLMKPVFFVNGNALPLGVKDAERRGKLAEWMTSTDNPWFAKAFVNRMWAELCGEGFYNPVDDLGPEREPTAPKTLDYLAQEFAASGYDIKWLFQTVTSTELYQRVGRSRRGPEGIPFEANVIQPLRGDQLYSSLQAALGLPEVAGAAGRGGPYGLARSPRVAFNIVFGFDPSMRRDEVSGTIPQAQALMNSPALSQAINAQRGTLAALLRDYPDNGAAVEQLYLRTVSRLPTNNELRMGLSHIRSASSRGEAMEDLMWALVNSAEFAHRP